MCLDLGTGERVHIDKKIGYAVTEKRDDYYIPFYCVSYNYEKEKRYRATYRSYTTDEEGIICKEIAIRKNSKVGGFYFFPTKHGALKLKNLGGNRYRDIVVIRCLFEDIFEKGKWCGNITYRAKFRTILEEVVR